MRFIRLLPAALLAIGLSVLVTSASWAAPEAAKFSQAAFSLSQQAGKPILVEITAPWCPVCAKQRPILSQLLTEPAFDHLVVYHIDFDSQKDAVREMGATMQSTLIVFNGSHEEGRSTGVTDPGAIKALLDKAAG
ncbi:thioredoxin family protein [Rhodopila sp.]|uniref:thioredoxin family protein n=1 Tax=Rhodopila sp. TaxID=2480087 RepID=UPI003D0DF098